MEGLLNTNKKNNHQDDMHVGESIDFGKIFRLLMMQSKLVLLIVLITTALAASYYIFSTKTYKTTSLIQITQNSSFTRGDEFDIFAENETNDISSIENIYKSRSNLLRVIGSKYVHITSNEIDLKKEQIFNKFILLDSPSKERLNFKVTFNDKNFNISFEDGPYQTFSYETESKGNNFIINLSKPSSLQSADFYYKDPGSVYRNFRSKFEISNATARQNAYTTIKTGLLKISFLSTDKNYGAEILNYTNQLFIDENIKQESLTATKAIEFIDERISILESQLDSNKENLSQFQQNNNSVNVDLEIQSILGAVSEIESKINEIDLKIASASSNYTNNNPLYLDLINQKQQLLSQKSTVESQINQLPKAQQSYIDLYRDLQFTEKLYEQLVNQRLEYSIKEASTLGNIRIIDNAYYDSVVSPTFLAVFAAFMASLLISILIAVYRGLFLLPITNPAELLDNKIFTPIVGVTSKDEDTISSEGSERFNQGIESMIVNIKSVLKEKDSVKRAKTILITSPTASNGKSYLTRNIATKLAKLNSRVLLIDNDLKRGDQHKSFNLPKIRSEDFYSINSENINKFEVNKNLFVIPKIMKLKSSFQFLYSPEYMERIDFFKEFFDYIIIDTAPILSVSDSSILMSHSDINLLATRHGLTKINEIRQSLKIAEQIGVGLDGIIYNAYERPSSYYGYYGLYGNYSYQYYAQKYLYDSYTYDEKK